MPIDVSFGNNYFPVEAGDNFPGWRQYPLNVVFEPTAVHAQSYNDKISDLQANIFCHCSSETDIEITDIRSNGSYDKASKTRLQDAKLVEEYMIKNKASKTRIISLHSQTSLDPVKVTEECLRKILTHHCVDPAFLDMLFSIGGKPRDSDAGSGGMTVMHRADGSYDMYYLMVYVEESRGRSKSTWPIRQTVVFHRFTPNSQGNLWILIHPMPNSILKQRLEVSLMSENNFLDAPGCAKLHLLVLSSYINNWRWYLNALSKELEKIADSALTLDFSRPEDYTDGFQTLTKLQYLEERLIPLPARFQASQSVIDELMYANELFRGKDFYDAELYRLLSNNLRQYGSKYRGHERSVGLFCSRVRGLINMLSVSLNLKNQATSVDLNHNMLLLTKDTVDDSATVRVVTLVTLIYLPASFISSLLGMNLFSFQGSNGPGFQISQQFWVFIALSVPLTILTVGSWFYFSYKRQRSKILQEEAIKHQRPMAAKM